jgi:hypothetical protein
MLKGGAAMMQRGLPRLRPALAPPISLAPLLNNTGLAITLPTLEHVVAGLDRATPQPPRTPYERWRYSFSWGTTEIAVVGFARRAMIYGTNDWAMSRLAEVITFRCMNLLIQSWPRAAMALRLLNTLLDRYSIDRANPWAFQPTNAHHAAYCRDLARLLEMCASISAEGFIMLYHVCIRLGMPRVAVWLDHMLVAHDAGIDLGRARRGRQPAFVSTA